MGGSSGSTSYDPIASYAALYSAQQTNARADELFNLYKQDFLPYDQAALQTNTQLMGSYSDLAKQEAALESQVNPSKADATQAAYQEALYDINDTRGLRNEQRSQQLQALQNSAPVSQAFYKAALDGITPAYEQRMGEATSDVAQTHATANNDTAMAMARLGVDPTSAKALAALNGNGLSQAKDIAAARTSARDAERTRVEDTNFNRLTTAMNARQNDAKGEWATDYGSVAAGGLPYTAAQTSYSTTSNPLSASTNLTSSANSALASLAGRSTGTTSNDGGSGVLSALGLLGGAAIGKYSSARFKTDIQTVFDATSFPALDPVVYRYKDDPKKQEQLGFIAEALAKTLPEVVCFDADGRPEAVDYGKLTVMLYLENCRLQKHIVELEGRMQ